MRAATVAKAPRAASTAARADVACASRPASDWPRGDELGGESVALGFGCGIRLDQVLVLGGEAVTRSGGLLRRRDRGLGGDVSGLERGDTVSAGARRGIGVRGTRRAGGLGGRALSPPPRASLRRSAAARSSSVTGSSVSAAGAGCSSDPHTAHASPSTSAAASSPA